MEDARLEWIRDRVYNGLNISEVEVFERFLDDDRNDDILRKFFSSSSTEETAYAILFYLEHQDKERTHIIEYEVEVEVTDDEEEEPDDKPSGTTIDSDARSVSSKRSKASSIARRSRKQSTAKSVKSDDLQKKNETREKTSGTTVDGGEDDEDREPTPPPRRTKLVMETRERVEIEHYIFTTLHVVERRIPENRQDRPSIYFLRNLQTKLPTPADAEQARATMPRFIEYGVLSQSSLVMLQQLMTNIYVPLLNSKSSVVQADDSTQAKPNMLRDEFMLNMNKFVQQIRRTINQIEGRFGLEIPEGDGP